MQNIQKRKNQYFKNFLYKRVQFVPSIIPLYALIVLLNILFSSIVSIEYIMSTNHEYINVGTQALFYIQIGLISGFFIITAASVFSVFFKHIWMYYLLFLESTTILFARSLGICFAKPASTFFQGKITFKIGQAAIFTIFCLIISIFRNNAYYPFQNVSHLFSMRQKNCSVYLLVFNVCLGLITYHDIFSSKTEELKALLVITFLMFWKSRDSGYLHQFSRKIWDIYYYFITWTCFTFFVANFINLINDKPNMKTTEQTLSFRDAFLYFWVYTFPFVMMLPIFKSKTVRDDFWKKIFEIEDHQLDRIYQKQQIYILCDQLHKIVESLKKSQLKYKDPDFKKLWAIIKKHNSKCAFTTCPLQQLVEHKDESNDDFHEHRKFLKTLKNCLQFSRINLQKLKQKNPDETEIEIQLAHFYLIALKNKQKGMLLYNSYHTKKVKRKEPSKETQEAQSEKPNQGNMESNKKSKNSSAEINKNVNQYSFTEKYAIYFLKKEIDNIFIGEQKQANTNTDNELSQFRQKIEVSVTMLAQFWSLLADPKCNLKKMYDLTNFLFPLKLSLEQDWERIKLLKNIEIYSVYAKYLIRMFNDKQNGIKILDEANKIDHQLKNKDQIELDDKGGELLEQNGIIFMEYDGKNSGRMFQINVNAEKIFGYNKGELLNKKVNDIMPKIYADQHDRVLENYQQTNYSTMMNKERHVWGKSKQGFLVPFTILIKPILSFYSQASSSQVYANIKRQNYLKETAGIIIDTKEMVNEYSTSALGLFPALIQNYENRAKCPGYKFKKQQEKRAMSTLSIYQILPNFKQIKEKILVENQQYDLKIERKIKTSRNGEDSFIEKCVYSISITQINIKTSGKIGHLIKLVKMGNSEYMPIQNQALQPNSLNSQQDEKNKNPVKMDFLGLALKQEKENGSDLLGSKINKKDKQHRVKFDPTEEILPDRKFIFSYDMSNKLKNFAASIKQIDGNKGEKQPRKSSKRVSEEKNKQMTESERRQMAEMKYVGGYTKSEDIINKMRNETLSGFKAQLKVSEQKNEETKIDYAKGIKPKRLTDNVIKQLREQEIELEFTNGQGEGEKEQQSQEFFSEIKPSELSLILSKESKNKYIVNLRIITALLLILCSVLCIVQYNITGEAQQTKQDELLKIKQLGEIKTEMLCINMFINYLTQFSSVQPLTFHKMHENIDLLNEKLNNYMFTQNAELIYSDGSSDNYYLGFAMNKLISQANSAQMGLDGRLINSPSTFFVQYNTVNGMSIGLDQQSDAVWQNVLGFQANLLTLSYIFLGVGLFIGVLMIMVKNILLRLVIHKKTQILQIFFQIPRAACSIIQKECEAFIIQLSVENQEEQIQMENDDTDIETQQNKNAKVQKKRTIVGEENTQFMYGIVSILFLFLLIFYQLFILAQCNIQKSDMDQLTKSTKLFYTIQYKLFQMATFMESIIVNNTIPINKSTNRQTILAAMNKTFNEDILEVRINFYELQRILDEEFDQMTSKLYYESVCGEGEICKAATQEVAEENNGLNSVVSRYLQVLKKNYRLLSIQKNPTPNQDNFLELKMYQSSMKEHWRQLTQLIKQSEQRYIDDDGVKNLWVLVSVCIVYLIFFMVGWMKYYWRLEQRIVATEYILAFIPIDEVNKNKKIANYIRNEISSRK